MPSLAAGLAAERRRKNAKHARRLEKKLGVKVAGSEERRLSSTFSHSVAVLSRTFSRRRSSDAFDMSRAEQLAQESRAHREQSDAHAEGRCRTYEMSRLLGPPGRSWLWPDGTARARAHEQRRPSA